jgi:Co/Zn/Cd efflux system component
MAALVYRCAGHRRLGPRFAFDTGKLDEFTAFTSAVVLAIIALAIGDESLSRVTIASGAR